MTTRIIEGNYPPSTKEEREKLDNTFEAIETYFDKIVFSTQKFIKGMLQDEVLYTLPKEELKSIIVDTNNAIDEFYLAVEKPIVIRYWDGEPVYSNEINIEVVSEDVAIGNDHDFGATSEDGYEVGGTGSYYKLVGEINGTNYYYREL